MEAKCGLPQCINGSPRQKVERQRRSARQAPSGMQGGIGISAETALASAIAAARINKAFFNMGEKSPLFLAVSRVTRSQSKGRPSRVEKTRKVFRKPEHLLSGAFKYLTGIPFAGDVRYDSKGPDEAYGRSR